MFFKCKTIEQSKSLYEKLVKKLHPDFGGDYELMLLLNDAFESNIKIINEKEKNIGKEKKYVFQYGNIYQGDERLEIFIDIQYFALTHSSFDMTYVESLKKFLSEKGYLTGMKYNRLVYLFYSYNMDEEK